MTRGKRVVVSVAGAAGSGKSQLALAVVQVLGDEDAARVPMDYFIEPRIVPMELWLTQPLAYNRKAVDAILRAPDGTVRLCPPFDFTALTRSDASGERKRIPIRPVMVLDAMEPWPDADLSVLVETPKPVRYRRIVERDIRWGSRVIDRWEHLELCRQHIQSLDHQYDLTLDGEQPLNDNAARIVEALHSRDLFPQTFRRG